METQRIGLNDYRALFLLSFIILMVGIIPYGLVDPTLPWACFVTSGSLFMVGLGMFLNQGQISPARNYSVKTKHSKSMAKSSGKPKPARIVRKNTPKSSKRR